MFCEDVGQIKRSKPHGELARREIGVCLCLGMRGKGPIEGCRVAFGTATGGKEERIRANPTVIKRDRRKTKRPAGSPHGEP